MDLVAPQLLPHERPDSRALGQFFCPEYAAKRLVEAFFADLSAADYVVDAGCGPGAFLKALPWKVPAIGVEIDPDLAERARVETGREVLVGDFRVLPLPKQPTAILGNPPYDFETREAFLLRAADLLPRNGRCGWLLPATALSFASTVERWRQYFSIRTVAVPRDLFPRIAYPLSFVLFSKDGACTLDGFALFDEAADVGRMPKSIKFALVHGRPRESVWRAAVREALTLLGGRGRLADIYSVMALRCPRAIRTWEGTVRRTLQEGFVNVRRGEWAIAGTCR
jgi:site-specific DNA-methyltransferase (adenine-specific)